MDKITKLIVTKEFFDRKENMILREKGQIIETDSKRADILICRGLAEIIPDKPPEEEGEQEKKKLKKNKEKEV